MIAKHKGKRKLIVIFAGCVICLALLLSIIFDFLEEKEAISYVDIAMGTVVDISLYGGTLDVAENVFNSIKKLENEQLSWRIVDSDIYKINTSDGKLTAVGSYTAGLISEALALCEDSGGALDITIGSVMQLWDFGGENQRLPSNEEISKALTSVDYSKVFIQDSNVRIDKGQFLDLGALGKGIACDRAAMLLETTNVQGANVSVGGSILIYGEKPDSKVWSVGIRNPVKTQNDYFAIVKTQEAFISTSGSYEKNFYENGEAYHHIISPKTGYPATNSNLLSVTVFANSGLVSDALSTACFVMGYEKSLPILADYSAEAVFVDKEKNVYVTDGLRSSIELSEGGFKLHE